MYIRDEMLLFNQQTQMLCQVNRTFEFSMLGYDNKLFSAVAIQVLRGAGIGPDQVGYLDKNFITHYMAVGIINFFEVINVKDQDRSGKVGTAEQCIHGIEFFILCSAITRAREWVGSGEVLKPGLLAFRCECE